MRRHERGFTLIELLVVMIIIGILAAIAIPVFLSQKQKARDTTVKADLAVLGKGITSAFVNTASAPTVGTSAGYYVVNSENVGRISPDVLLLDYAASPAAATSLITTGMSAGGWCVNLRDGANSSSTIFKFSAQNGLETGKCASATTP